jgi:hypothetical protein
MCESCEGYLLAEKSSIMSIAMAEMWELLAEEQKRKVAAMRMDIIIKIFEMKICDMEKMIEIKKEAINNLRTLMLMIEPVKPIH